MPHGGREATQPGAVDGLVYSKATARPSGDRCAAGGAASRLWVRGDAVRFRLRTFGRTDKVGRPLHESHWGCDVHVRSRISLILALMLLASLVGTTALPVGAAPASKDIRALYSGAEAME